MGKEFQDKKSGKNILKKVLTNKINYDIMSKSNDEARWSSG